MTVKEFAKLIIDTIEDESKYGDAYTLDSIMSLCEKQLNKGAKQMKQNYTKGDCYAICEFLEELLSNHKLVIPDICRKTMYDSEPIIKLLTRLHNDIDDIIAQEQAERNDTDSMAEIMELNHISGHEDND